MCLRRVHCKHYCDMWYVAIHCSRTCVCSTCTVECSAGACWVRTILFSVAGDSVSMAFVYCRSPRQHVAQQPTPPHEATLHLWQIQECLLHFQDHYLCIYGGRQWLGHGAEGRGSRPVDWRGLDGRDTCMCVSVRVHACMHLCMC